MLVIVIILKSLVNYFNQSHILLYVLHLPFRISVYNEETSCVGLARVGCEDQMIVAGLMKQLLNVDFGPPLHCLVIVGDTHPVEEEMLEFYKIGTS